MNKIIGRIQSKILNYLSQEKEKQLYARNGERNNQWIEEYLLEEEKSLETNELAYTPLISIFLVGKEKKESFPLECVKSICSQSYTRWEICILDSMKAISINTYLKENSLCNAIREVSSLVEAKGEFISIMDVNDLIPSFALYEMVLKLNEGNYLNYIYSDEDEISQKGKRWYKPFFKPDWSPDLMLTFFYTKNMSLYRTSMINELGGLDWKGNGNVFYDLALRVTEKIERDSICHIPKVLYYKRSIEQDTREEGAKEAIIESLNRRQVDGIVLEMPNRGRYRVVYKVKETPLVSIVIPSKNNHELLTKCLDSIKNNTEYNHYEIIVVDNGSEGAVKINLEVLAREKNFRYYYEEMEFNFSRMCNIGVAQASGEYILLLNDDVEVAQRDWLELMLGQGSLEKTGAVGAKLLYPNSDRIQHVGVGIPPYGPDHVLMKKPDNECYYFGRNQLSYNYLTVTAACLLIKKDKYLEVDGFDETFPVAYNDVDFCFKLYEKGYNNVVRNDVVLYHHESYSRGDDSVSTSRLDRIRKELERLYQKHPHFSGKDPFYNKNLCTEAGMFFETKEVMGRVNYRVMDKRKSDYEKDESFIDAHIDKIEENNEEVYLEGWALADMDYDFLYSKYMVFWKADGRTIELLLNKVFRPDIKDFLGERAAFSGYSCKISTELFESIGEYRIGIAGRYKWYRRFTWLDEKFRNYNGN